MTPCIGWTARSTIAVHLRSRAYHQGRRCGCLSRPCPIRAGAAVAGAVADGRRGGAVAKEIEALFLLAIDDYFAGEWDDLEAATNEGIALCNELGYLLTAAPGRYLRALVDSARGQSAAADRAAEQILLWAAPRRLNTLAAYASHVRCMEALGKEQFEPAYRHAASISPAGTLQPFQPPAVWVVFDLVEAATRSGHAAEASEHARVAQESGLGARSPRLELLIAAAGALTDPKNWRERFRQALTTPESERWIFDRARVQLLFGEELRRGRAHGEARTELTSAITGFRRLRATPWLKRAARELRAAGGTEPDSAVLTPQEAAVADLAATGLTNKQIATQLFLSPRTVSTHLSHAYTKLGITSRGAMRDAIDRTRYDLRH